MPTGTTTVLDLGVGTLDAGAAGTAAGLLDAGVAGADAGLPDVGVAGTDAGLVDVVVPQRVAATETATCVCGHGRDAHEHYRRGNDCALCTCPKYRRRR